MAATPPALVSGWLRSAAAEPIDAKYVPGASNEELSCLAALGSLASQLTPPGAELLPTAVNEWLSSDPKPPATVVSAARNSLDADADSALAALYANLVSSAHRRSLGTFFTPSPEATLMLGMWEATQPAPTDVVDIGAGVGVFTAAASNKWPKARVTAIDINPVTLGLLALHPQVSPKLVAHSDQSAGIELVLDDFTKWIAHLPDDDSGSRLYLGNPPYTRAQLLPREDRARLQETVDGLVGGRASLSASITALCVLHLRPADGVCLLLPAQWLESDYARPLRERLWTEKSRRIELRLVDSRLFPDAQVDAVALLIGTTRSDEQEFAVGLFDDELRALDREGSCPPEWRGLFGGSGSAVHEPRESVRLGDIAKIRRGLATGANAFFLLNASEMATSQIPERLLQPVIRRLKLLSDSVTAEELAASTGDTVKSVLMATTADRRASRRLDRYLTVGEESGIDSRLLCQRRDTWFDLAHDAFIPDVIISAMTRRNFRVVTNGAKALITNNLYGWVWKPDVSDSTRNAVVDWLRSPPGQDALHRAARQQGDGLSKLEPKALAAIEIPRGQVD